MAENPINVRILNAPMQVRSTLLEPIQAHMVAVNMAHDLGSHTDADFPPVEEREDGEVITWDGDLGAFVLAPQVAPAPGALTFLELTDTPAAYAGQGGKVVAVKMDTTGLEFIVAPEGGEGPQGEPGIDGLTAYEIAVANGFVGTEVEWLDSLEGPQGIQGEQGDQGPEGEQGAAGTDGLSAYEIAVANGFVGTIEEWLDSLEGPQGIQGEGGISAYEVAVIEGFVGDEAAWLASLVGEQGPQGIQGEDGPQGIQGEDGISAYEVAVDNGFVGTEVEWLASLEGPQGIQGIQGEDGPQGVQGDPGEDGDAADIAAETSAASTDDSIEDASLWGRVTGGVWVKTTWSNIKAVLKTYFDTLYNLYVHPNHTGDVTSVADGATTIAANAVTYAKMQDVSATDRFLGRDTAGAGDVEEITPTAARAMLNVADGANAYTHPNHSGDVTSTGDGVTVIGANKVLTAMIADAQITLAKQSDLAADRIIGRANGAGTGVPQALTPAQVAAIINTALDHGALLGLSDNDHPQYGLLASMNTWAGVQNFQSTTQWKAASLAHGMTDWLGTDTSMVFLSQSASEGGQYIIAATDVGTRVPLHFMSILGDASPTVAAIILEASMKNGTTKQAITGTLPAVDFNTNNTNILRLLASGNLLMRNSARLVTDGVRALDSDGLRLEDDAGVLGVFIEDTTGDVAIGGHTTPVAKLDVLQATLGSIVMRLFSTASGDDPIMDVIQNRITTTDATVTTLHTFTIPTSTTVGVLAFVTARRTGGSSGSAHDGAFYVRAAAIKGEAGTALGIGAGNAAIATLEDQAGWEATFDVTSNTARLRVTGATNNTITWHVTALVFPLSS